QYDRSPEINTTQAENSLGICRINRQPLAALPAVSRALMGPDLTEVLAVALGLRREFVGLAVHFELKIYPHFLGSQVHQIVILLVARKPVRCAVQGQQHGLQNTRLARADLAKDAKQAGGPELAEINHLLF